MKTTDQIQQKIDSLHARYAQTLRALDEALTRLEFLQASVIKNSSPEDELHEAARLMSMSDLNKEDLSANAIYEMMVKTSESEVSSKAGFWAVPLPKSDDPKPAPNKRYTTK